MNTSTMNERRVPRQIPTEDKTMLTRRDLTGVGRDELEMMLIAKSVVHEEVARENVRLANQNAALMENLTATQTRCNQLLADFRASKFVEAVASVDPELVMPFGNMMVHLAATMVRARVKHPNGPEGMRSLASEVGEVATAELRETPERVREELLDVAVVALRWWNGETKVSP